MLTTKSFRRSTWVCATAAAALLAWVPASQARVTRIIIDAVLNPIGGQPLYEQLTGRAFGELDPADAHNALITDLASAPKNVNGKVDYIASFVIRKPIDMGTASGLMWHDVPNRGGNVAFPADSFAAMDMHLLSGWQGDNAGGTVVPVNADCIPPYVAPCAAPPFANHWVKVPVLTGVTGRIFGRIINRSGLNQPLNVMGQPIPYFPENSADNTGAVLKTHLHETMPGVVTEGETIPNSAWKFCYGAGATFAAPGSPTSLPVRVCLDGSVTSFDPLKLYQLQYTVKDPYVLGAGTAAFRDVMSFFRYEPMDDFGTLNPVAGKVSKAIMRGSSQSGNFTRHYIHLDMNRDESGRILHEGAWPLIAGRRVANNSRWGQPDGVLELYQMGSEGPQWWYPWPDVVRGLPTKGILDRCSKAPNTCPKIIETFGGAEVFALKMTTSWVGTSADMDIPVPRNVRRYYLPSSTHGGNTNTLSERPSLTGVNCPGNAWGTGTLPQSPVPATGMVNRMRAALRAWVMVGTLPPPSRYPTIAGKTLVDPTMAAMGFPHGVKYTDPVTLQTVQIPATIFHPDNFVNPVLDYDWGPQYDHDEANGIPTNAPPPIKHVIRMKVPRVDADGNELGGLPTVTRDAPLGTYLGWNITSSGFHAGQQCNYTGGMVPFAKTKAQRLAAGDPRKSLEERYVTHAGYVAAVRAAADSAACQGYLHAGPAAAAMGAKCTAPIPAGLPDDWAVLVNAAMASNVCNQAGDGGMCNPGP